ncbi:HTH-type transcriptional repressor YtrA [Polystyrenella longa]|uniref:HTH-type transcriptional repressor YtrA n=1 Tax=Polystyrenella longa TaxID=2528007 RepID=A0A518CKN6_9PLAN|nr:GntR family transcriptional regulator [Polystyrenella longa]QDU79790.1 HTH-type transcriptional repressor YtrA [Polystyrenella longa]
MQIQITTGSNVPIYKQIVEQVRQAVASGDLKEGDPLPSVRALANKLVINHNTVAKAYAHIVQEGIAVAQPGRGLFASAVRNIYSDSERQRRLQEAFDRFVSDVLSLGYTKDELSQFLHDKIADSVLIKE